jgi:hypothetical protein
VVKVRRIFVIPQPSVPPGMVIPQGMVASKIALWKARSTQAIGLSPKTQKVDSPKKVAREAHRTSLG